MGSIPDLQIMQTCLVVFLSNEAKLEKKYLFVTGKRNISSATAKPNKKKQKNKRQTKNMVNINKQTNTSEIVLVLI